MAIFKCKICGGALEIEGAATVATCEYCGTKQTLPRLDDDRKANLYDRANHFRRNNDFDKAMSIYEQILNEDNTDAESYWSILLCRYGIEYVEDPATRKRVPTVNRAQFTSIFDDEDYKSALQCADGEQREIYETEAAVINEIQKNILAISQKEEPFDVFICYKETDAHGRRTPDSVLATELYHELTREGFKVFFSRITLEDKLGVAYEPYIFAALHSAKVMVVLGTRPEHFSAVWVKNEWGRYLALIKNGAKKTLIPAYRDMDPYDLPEEFSHLQAQDMAKLGFMQDLTRGIKKIVGATAQKASAKDPSATKETTSTPTVPTTITPYLKRIFLFLEDSNWESADEYCEKVLDIDPESALAYLGKLMVELEVEIQEDLKNCEEPFDENKNYQKAVRFGDAKLKETLTGYIEYINARNENARLEALYQEAVELMDQAEDEDEFLEAARSFEEISGYKDADELKSTCLDELYNLALNLMKNTRDEVDYLEAAEHFRTLSGHKNSESLMRQCLEFAEAAGKDAILEIASNKMTANTIRPYTEAIELLESIRGWKDADERILECHQEIEKLHAINLEKERQAELARIEQEKRDRTDARIALIILGITILTIVALALFFNVIQPNAKYNNAVELMNAGKYSEAISIFESLDGHKDSESRINECLAALFESKYNYAVALMETGNYTEAITAFRELDGHKDSESRINECLAALFESKYNYAVALMEIGNYTEAITAFRELDGYKDSESRINECLLINCLRLAKEGDCVLLGTYEQDNDAQNGKEDIEWLVLEKKDDSLLLISKYVLDCKAYSTSGAGLGWSECTLRTWLNNSFVNSAFSKSEIKLMGNATASVGKIFLLNAAEANKYFVSNSARQCVPTAYAIANGIRLSNGKCNWWLRTSGDQNHAAMINFYGTLGSYQEYYDPVVVGVRPAMWINISSTVE